MPLKTLPVVKKPAPSGRDRILLRALELFSRNGYRQTTLSQILAATSMTKGAFYHHWRSKEELAIEIIDRTHERYRLMRPQVLTEAGAGSYTLAQLRRIRGVHHSPEGVWGRFFICMLSHLGSRDRRIAAKLAQVLQLWRRAWADLVRADRRRGVFRVDIDPGALAALLQGAVIGHLIIENDLCEGDPFQSALAVLKPLMKEAAT